MKVGLFIPCYVNQFYPNVAIATLELLEKLDITVEYPENQTCCGQPMANSGYEKFGVDSYNHFVKNFSEVDYIVSPSGSCTYHVKHHYDIIEQSQEVQKVRENIYELGDFLKTFGYMEKISASFPHKVGIHQSCHGLRGLRLGSGSERVMQKYSMTEDILSKVKGIELVELNRTDECCGFGGTFAVSEEAISVRMGKDRVGDHIMNGAEVITGTDVSCLMHMEGIIKRDKLPVRVMHFAEILNS